MHNILSERYKKVKYAHYTEDCPLKNSPICESKSRKSSAEMSKRRNLFRNDGVLHSNKQLIIQKRAKETKVTGKHNDSSHKLIRPGQPTPGSIDTFYQNNLKSQLKRPAFVNDSIKMSYKQTSVNGRYLNGEHDWRVSRNDPLMPRYEPLEDAWIKRYFKKPVVKNLMKKTMPGVKVN